ncbi:long-chain fatty acid--CoA ligase, partial [bacterium]|nr:long-chain fatty acid--CoA ligase [bacterium]
MSEWFLERMETFRNNPAIIWHNQTYSYDSLLQRIQAWREKFKNIQIQPGNVVSLVGDFSPEACAILLALIENRNIIVPLASAIIHEQSSFLDLAEVQVVIKLGYSDEWTVEKREVQVQNALMYRLIEQGTPGLVLFSSGSTGKHKAALHNFEKLLVKFKTPRRQLRTLTFLLFDHIGGINTLFYTLSNRGTIISIDSRDPESVCRAIQEHRVQLLPVSPTFLNLLLLSEQYKNFDLSSLEMITYGTEEMPESTLRRMNELFPRIRMLQTYGLSELGILRSKSKDSNSLWVKVGGEGFETKIVNGILWIKAESAMLGYLNAPSPFDEEGWFNTGDAVEVDGDYIRILGRESEMINVGGEKVYPAEVENVLIQMDNIQDVTVYGENNPIT